MFEIFASRFTLLDAYQSSIIFELAYFPILPPLQDEANGSSSLMAEDIRYLPPSMS